VPFAHDIWSRRQRASGKREDAGVVFVPKFLEIFLEFPDEDLVSAKMRFRVGVDDASLTFNGGGAVGLASVLTGARSASECAYRGLSGSLETSLEKAKGSPEGTALLTTTVAASFARAGAKA